MKIALPALLALALALLLPACTPVVHPTRGATPHPALAGLGAGAARGHFTRVVVPPDLEIRWVEATLVDPAWVEAEAREYGRLAPATAEEVAARSRKQLQQLGWGSGDVAFEVWAFVQCEPCVDLARWRWELAGPDPTQPARAPRDVRSEEQDRESQTLGLYGVARTVTVHELRGALRFAGPLGPGLLVLQGVAGPGFDPLRFEWKIED